MDPIFWSQFMLPPIFFFEYTHTQAKILFETLLFVKINCPNLDLAKYLVLLEKILDEFKNLEKDNVENVKEIRLKIEKDYGLIPKKASGEEIVNLREIEKEMNKNLGKNMTVDNYVNSVDKEEVEGEMVEAQVKIKKKITKKDEKKLMILERRAKKETKQKDAKEGGNKKVEVVSTTTEEESEQDKPKLKQKKEIPTVVDVDGPIKSPKGKFKANLIVKKGVKKEDGNNDL